jgi:uncharacterized membrane protein YphA (DoxX/SURF4 family)
MLNPFPIQFLTMLAHFLLRLFVGGVCVYLGARHIRHRNDMRNALNAWWLPGLFTVWYMAAIELIIGTLFILGLYTQIAALVAMILAIKMIIFHRRFTSPYIPGRAFYVLLFAISLSLFITGAGAIAFDLPI